MRLDLSLEEGRVLDLVVAHVMNDKALSEQIFAGYTKDVVLLGGIAGRLRALYVIEKENERQK